jgi:16S rRNA processing protein RimM
MIKQEDVYKIGRLGRPHGVRGEVTMQVGDDVFDRTDADHLILSIDGILVPFFMEEYRFRSNEVALIKFEDIDSEDRARELTGCDVYFERQQHGDEDEEMTWAEIIGFSIVDAASAKTIGTISRVDDSTLNVLFEVTTDDGRDLLIPAGEDMVTAVDRAGRTITMEIPEGLLSL